MKTKTPFFYSEFSIEYVEKERLILILQKYQIVMVTNQLDYRDLGRLMISYKEKDTGWLRISSFRNIALTHLHE